MITGKYAIVPNKDIRFVTCNTLTGSQYFDLFLLLIIIKIQRICHIRVRFDYHRQPLKLYKDQRNMTFPIFNNYLGHKLHFQTHYTCNALSTDGHVNNNAKETSPLMFLLY